MIAWGFYALLSLLLTSSALAGKGWYLLYPLQPGTQQDLRSWEQYGAYDTAAECEQERAYWWKNIKKDDRLYVSATLARCIASDDPRLKGK